MRSLFRMKREKKPTCEAINIAWVYIGLSNSQEISAEEGLLAFSFYRGEN